MRTNHGEDHVGAILDIREDLYDHKNVDPRGVGTNHGGDPLGAISDMSGGGGTI